MYQLRNCGLVCQQNRLLHLYLHERVQRNGVFHADTATNEGIKKWPHFQATKVFGLLQPELQHDRIVIGILKAG